MCNLPTSPPMDIGRAFNSFDQLSQCIKDFSTEYFVPLYIRDAKTLESAQKTKPKRILKANKNLHYYSILYACSHGGRTFKTRGNAIRETQTLKTGCPMKIRLSLSPDGQNLVITEINETHNHVLDNNESLLNEKYYFAKNASPESLPDVNVSSLKRNKRCSTYEEKHKRAEKICSKLPFIMAELSTEQFNRSLKNLQILSEMINNHKKWTVIELNDPQMEEASKKTINDDIIFKDENKNEPQSPTLESIQDEFDDNCINYEYLTEDKFILIKNAIDPLQEEPRDDLIIGGEHFTVIENHLVESLQEDLTDNIIIDNNGSIVIKKSATESLQEVPEESIINSQGIFTVTNKYKTKPQTKLIFNKFKPLNTKFRGKHKNKHATIEIKKKQKCDFI